MHILRGGVHINKQNANNTFEILSDLEKMENSICSIPVTFAEMFKDEINANDEERLYNGVKRIIKKYSGDRNTLAVLNEFTSVISGGASLHEILQITKEEAENPSAVTDITVSKDCNIH